VIGVVVLPSASANRKVAGGRVERECGEPADVKCSRCGNATCDDHLRDSPMYEVGGKPVCEDCLEPDEADSPIFEE
jgi:hypothetical protein